jgi:hypothetical protein
MIDRDMEYLKVIQPFNNRIMRDQLSYIWNQLDQLIQKGQVESYGEKKMHEEFTSELQNLNPMKFSLKLNFSKKNPKNCIY